MSDQNFYQTPSSENLPIEVEKASTSEIVVKVFMWLSWGSLFFPMVTLLAFVHKLKKDVNNWFSSDPVWIITFLLFLILALLVRFFGVRKIKKPWVNLIVYWVGLFCSFMILSTGLFMFTSGQYTYYLTAFAVVFTYCPFWVTFTKEQA